MPAPVTRPAKGKRNQVRIIGGTLRSRIVDFPSVAGLRPTGDRVRETVFNWLGQSLHGKRCLDLFAGSGAMGFEAVSRGAERVVMIDASRSVWQALNDNAVRLGVSGLPCGALTIIHADAAQYVRQCREQFDVVFLDPPFASTLLEDILGSLAHLLSDNGVVYVEAGAPLANLPAGWLIIKQSAAGQVHYGLLHQERGAP